MNKMIPLILFVTFWLFSTFSLVALPAYADVKCGGFPMAFGQEGLGVAWTSSALDKARVTQTDLSIFKTVSQVTGPEIPKDFPEKYTKNLITAAIFNLDEIQKHPVGIFADSIKSDNVKFGVLVEHPNVANLSEFTACSVVLQQGVIVYDNEGTSVPRETLFFRAYFHSAKDSENFVNFVPRGAIEMSFPSETVWFPLERLQGIQEPASYVVLDILTPKPLNVEQLPKPFRLEKTAQMQYQGKSYSVARISATLTANQNLTELRLKT